MPAGQTKARKRAPSLPSLPGSAGDPDHHILDPFLPQTPLSAPSPARSSSPAIKNSFQSQRAKWSVFVRWAVDPYLSFKLLLIPVVLYLNWEFLSLCGVDTGYSNPFGHFFLLSGHIPTSTSQDPRYQKTYWDVAFLLYHVLLFSFVREYLSIKVAQPLAKFFGLKRESKIDRFGEQAYAFFYFTIFGAWGYRVMSQLPTYWYETEAFWNGYPEWDLKPELKRYYLMQFAYWLQQLLVLILGLERPRNDYWELVAHHAVTLWLVGGSYIMNCTHVGNAVFMSMDIPDAFFAFSKILNYMQWNTAKVYSLGIFFFVWTYFRHYLNLWILWSVWYEQPNVPEWTRHWIPSKGIFMPSWARYQIFFPLLILQFLNLFWYWLIIKVIIRGLTSNEVDDSRSDHEDDSEDEDSPEGKKEKKH